MAEIKDISAIQEKWSRVTPMRSEDYRIGVRSPKRDWEKSSIAAKENHKAAMVEAATKDSFAKGVQRSGNSNWQNKTLTKGPGRFAEGVMTGASDYGTAFAPFQSVIASTVLPPRFPRRDPRNLARVSAIATALGKAKTG